MGFVLIFVICEHTGDTRDNNIVHPLLHTHTHYTEYIYISVCVYIHIIIFLSLFDLINILIVVHFAVIGAKINLMGHKIIKGMTKKICIYFYK